MSYDYRYSQRSSTANRPGRRSFYAPPPPPSRNRHHHGLFTYWIPLVVAGTLAVGGLAAWVWSERNEHDDDHYPHDKPPRPQTGMGKPYPTQGSQPYPGPSRPPEQQPGPPPQYPPQGSSGPPPQYPPQGPGGPAPQGGESASYYDQSQSYRQTTETRETQQDDGTWYGRVSGMMKRTPSPQNLFNSASKQVGAGVAAVGGALGSIVEDHESVGSDHAYGEDSTVVDSSRMRKQRSSDKRTRRSDEKEGFSDHERWSEEADEKQRVGGGAVEQASEARAIDARERGKGKQKKAIAVVVSADTAIELGHEDDGGYMTEHASILSHLPSQRSSTTTDLFVLIYAPGLKSLPPADYQPNTSTNPTPATTPGSELQSISPRPMPADSPSRQFDALYSQALALVSSPTQILPFTTKDGYVHILRHLAPALVYISDTLSGDEGEDIAQLKGWVGHTILVAGDEGHGGLADTETETEAEDAGLDDGKGKKDKRKMRWYDNSAFVGLGKDVEVVDATRVGEDWERRVGGRE